MQKRHLNKTDWLKREKQMRDLWGEYDRAGSGENVAEEYEGFHATTMRLLVEGANDQDFGDHLREVCAAMGLEHNPGKDEIFLDKLRAWFDKHWAGTAL
jgi:hypothetical protein